jgi:hypothetical protein
MAQKAGEENDLAYFLSAIQLGERVLCLKVKVFLILMTLTATQTEYLKKTHNVIVKITEKLEAMLNFNIEHQVA